MTVFELIANILAYLLTTLAYCMIPYLKFDNQYKREPACRLIIETLTGRKFPSTRSISWLRNPLTNRNLELDGYNEELRIGMECNGWQHYKVVPKFHKKSKLSSNEDMERELDLQIFRDEVKHIQCSQHLIDLLYIPPTIERWRLYPYIYHKLLIIQQHRRQPIITFVMTY